MDDICQQLDETVLQIFQVLEDLYIEQDKLEQVMKDGFLGISRARYLLGVKWISADQILDANLAAKYTTLIANSIETDGSKKSALDNSLTARDTDRLSLFSLSEAIADVSIDDKGDDVNDVLMEADKDGQKGLRKRHTESDATENKSSQVEKTDKQKYSTNRGMIFDEVNDGESIKKEVTTKSLSLFGVLTPQPLRSSQKCFEEAVKTAVQLADLKLKLCLLQNEYRQLYKSKEKLLLDAGEGQ